jgi:hypothetical protein
MLTDWGIDAAFLIKVDKCCQPVGYCDVFTDPNDQWPVWGHDYARTSESGIELGDICGIRNAWTYYEGTTRQMRYTSPLIVNDKVYVFYYHNPSRVKCLDLFTGIPVWSSETKPWAASVVNSLADPAIEDGFLYLPTGATSGFLKIDALTGNMVWARGVMAGTPLPGSTGGWLQSSPPVIIGNALFFADDGGGLYALDKVTGADLYYTLLLVDPLDPSQGYAWMMGSLSSDGTNLFVGTANNASGPTAGAVYGLTPGGVSFTQNWAYSIPLAIQAVLPGGFISAPTYRCDNLFINSWSTLSSSGYCGFRQNLDPATGVEKWSSYFSMGSAWQSPPATIGGYTPMAVFANGNFTASGSVNSRAARAVNFSNTTVWINSGTAGDYDNNVHTHVTTTQDPYVFYGSNNISSLESHWKVADGLTGEILIDYAFTGYVLGTAIAHGSDGNDWIVVNTRFSDGLTAGGKVFAFRDMGPRPRMIVPESFVQFATTSNSETAPIQRTDSLAIVNIGCATLTFTATMDVAPAPSASFRSVSTATKKQANNLASRLIDHRVDDMMPTNEPAGKSKFFDTRLINGGDARNADWYMPQTQIKSAAANSASLAPPTWVSWVMPAGGVGAVVGPGTQDFTFQFDRSGMQLLGVNHFYVDIVSNDPDFFVEDTLAVPQAEIEYQIPYLYCDVDSGRMSFGVTGGEWWNNNGVFGDGAVAFEFTLDGSTDGAYLYAGTMFFMTSMNTAAWNPQGSSAPVGFGFLFPFYVSGTDCGGCQINTVLPVEYTTNSGVNYLPALHGDICSFAMIDSGQSFGFWPHQSGPSLGILVKYREVGAYGPDFGDFKLVVVDIINRSATTPINGLYYGNYEDWDIGAGANNGNGDVDKGIAFLNDGTVIRGQIGLPLKGSYWPDGVTKTDPMYNALILGNPDWVYPSATCPECLLDSLYAGIDSRPEGAVSYTASASASGSPDDLSTLIAFGKVDLAGGATKTYGFAMWGNDNSAAPLVDMAARAKFVNEFAGFDRGDIDGNDIIDLRDLVRLQRFLHSGGPGPIPFKHLGDVDNDGFVTDADCDYLRAYFFTGGTPPKSAFKF